MTVSFDLNEPSLLADSLMDSDVASQAHWYVVYTQPKSETLAADNLERQGFETYLPRYKTFKKSTDSLAAKDEPMFPRYVFFRPGNARQSITSARSTRGVSFVLSFGFQAAIVKVDQLKSIKAFEQQRNQSDVAQTSPFQPGIKVRMAGMNLQGLQGLVTSVSSQRVKVLLDFLGKSHEVSMDHHLLELV